MSTPIPVSGVYIAPPVITSTSLSAASLPGSVSSSVNYIYKFTYVTGFGETEASLSVGPVTTVTGSVLISNLPNDENMNIVSRRIYRNTNSAQTTWYLVDTINTKVFSYIDTKSDTIISSNSTAPDNDTSFSIQKISGSIQETMPKIVNFIVIPANGTNAATAALSKLYPRVYLTSSGAGQGIKLPAARASLVGLSIEYINDSNQSIIVYPYENSNGTITASGTSAGNFSLPSYTKVSFHLITFNSNAGQWKTY